jgi:hypothetical protein
MEANGHNQQVFVKNLVHGDTDHLFLCIIQLLLPPLQSLFANYQYGDDEVLPADEVRQVLGALYANMGKFQVD